MAEAAAYSGPDGTRFWMDGNAGFAHLALHTTPEAVFEQQPLRDPQTGTLWVADARVDNRDELIDLFKKRGEIQGEAVITDVDLLILAYRCWGEDFLPHIYGNYAFVMWDPTRQRILAGRDFLGLRPMFYMRYGQTVYFASVIRSILAVLPERPPLNELLIADYYRYNFDRWIAETIYLPIRRLPAACQITVDWQQEKIHQHWMIVNAPILRYQNDQEYYDQFLELFQTALKACARTADPLGIQLSGGIDSSSITCTLHKMWIEKQLGFHLPIVELCKMNHINDPSEDERLYHEAVVNACPQFSSSVISGENHWGLKEIGSEQGYHLDEPDIFVTRSLQAARLQQSRQAGCKVVLQGIGGDELCQTYCNDLDLLRDLPSSLWLEAVQSHYRMKGFLGILRLAGRSFLRKTGLQPLWAKLRDIPNPWLLPKWSQQLVASPPVFKLLIPVDFSSERQRIKQTLLFTDGFYLAMLEYNHHIAIETGVEVRYPFLDRCLIESAFRLPTEKLMDFKLILKPFLKTALSGILPEAIMQRTGKSVIGPTVNLGLRNKEGSKVEKLLIDARKDQSKYVDFPVYNKFWNDFIKGKEIPRRALFVPLMLQAWIDDNT